MFDEWHRLQLHSSACMLMFALGQRRVQGLLSTATSAPFRLSCFVFCLPGLAATQKMVSTEMTTHSITHSSCSGVVCVQQAGEKLALRDSTKGDVIMKLVPLIDNFEAAKNAIKVNSDAEQKIVDSYQVSSGTGLPVPAAVHLYIDFVTVLRGC